LAEDPVEIVRRRFEAFGRGDREAIVEDLHPSVVWDESNGPPDGRVYLGHDGFREWLADFRGRWGDFRLEIQEVVPTGEGAVVLARQRGRRHETGEIVDAPSAQVVDFADGKVTRVRLYLDHGEAMDAAGLSR
jgi:uncharacterized protein